MLLAVVIIANSQEDCQLCCSAMSNGFHLFGCSVEDEYKSFLLAFFVEPNGSSSDIGVWALYEVRNGREKIGSIKIGCGTNLV